MGHLISLSLMAQVAQGSLAFGPLGPPLGMFGLGTIASAKIQIVTIHPAHLPLALFTLCSGAFPFFLR
jgi:hypothetical protein